MLEALKFVQGAVAKKEIIEGLTHFRIANGKVKSYNGVIALCSSLHLDLDCAPLAEPMVKAIASCDTTVQLTMGTNGKLKIKSGAFQVFIPCTDKETPHVDPEGELYEIDGEQLMKAFETLAPFISTDASRPWSTGVLLDGNSAFATNNVIACEYWIGTDIPVRCNIPRQCVREMLRIKQAPTHVQVSEGNITFHYDSDRWIRCQLLDLDWPDLRRILDVDTPNYTLVSDDIFNAIEIIKPFADANGRMYIENGVVRTHFDEVEGASHIIQDLTFRGAYHMDMFKLMKGIAKQGDFTKWPSPCPFLGDRVRGVIIGVRL